MSLLLPSLPAPRCGPTARLRQDANGSPPGPGQRYTVHFPGPGPGVLPLSPARLQRQASQTHLDRRAVSATRHRFASPTSEQTLAQGLLEYFAANPGLKREGELSSAEAKQFFRCHDAVHVLYGCGTTMPDEAIVKLASIFGSTAGLGVLRGYASYDSLDIYTKLPLMGTLAAVAMSPYLVIRTIWRCSHQLKRWPWADHQQYLETPLHELRAQFGIKVAHGRAKA